MITTYQKRWKNVKLEYITIKIKYKKSSVYKLKTFKTVNSNQK